MSEEPIPGVLGQLTLERDDPYLEQKLQSFEKRIRAEREKTRANAFVVLRRPVGEKRLELVVLAGFVEGEASDAAPESAEVSVVGNEGLTDALSRAAAPAAPSAGERSDAPAGLAAPGGGVSLRKK